MNGVLSSAACAGGFLLLLPDQLFKLSSGRKIILTILFSLALPHSETQGGSVQALWQSFVVGVMSALPVVLSFEIVETLAELFESGRGNNLVTTIDPLSQGETSALRLILRAVLLGSMLASGFLNSLFRTLGEEFSASHVYAKTVNFDYFGSLLGEMLAKSILLFAPFAAIFMLVDFLLACLGRLLPGVNLQQESHNIKSIIGLPILLGALVVEPRTILSSFSLVAGP